MDSTSYGERDFYEDMGEYIISYPILMIYPIVVTSPGLFSPCRVAEEVIFGADNVTTGASNDFMQVSRVARQMVERFGFSKKIGQVAIGGPGGNPFLGQQVYMFVLIIENILPLMNPSSRTLYEALKIPCLLRNSLEDDHGGTSKV